MKENESVTSSWWFPENLKKKELEFRKNERIPVSSDDFGSYKIMLKSNDTKSSEIHAHNDLNPKVKISMVSSLLRQRFANIEGAKIFSVGCGLGHETKTLAAVFNSEVMGIDVSGDAIAYAQLYNSNENTRFEQKLVDSEFDLGQKYDICFCFEFYPFTRTNDRQFQEEILDALFNNLNGKGKIVIYHLYENEDSIKDNVEYLASKLGKKFYISRRLHPRVYNLCRNFFITNILTFLYNMLIYRKDISKRMVVFY